MKKFKRLFCIVCMLVLSLAACGKQDTDDGVKKFYNSMNDTTEAVGESTQSGLKAAAEENGKSVKKSLDILIVSDINSANDQGIQLLDRSAVSVLLWADHRLFRQIWQSHVSFRHTSG